MIDMEPIKIFYCYTPQDKNLRDELEKHLIILKRLKQITLRLNREVLAGSDWQHVQDARFQMADLILLLISPDFIASDYHYGVEMRHVLEKYEAGNVSVIPILLRPTAFWQKTPIGKLQVLPRDGKSITEQANQDAAFVDAIKEISDVVATLLTQKQELFSKKVNNNKFPHFTQVIGPTCITCGARNILEAGTCENCGDLLIAVDQLPQKSFLPEQTLLNGRYQLMVRIGRKGMKAVYKAIDTHFNDRPIAIKEMNRAGLPTARAQEMEKTFEHEATLLMTLLHPNLPRVHDYFSESECSYLVMDFIEEKTLEDYSKMMGGSPLSLEQVLKWAEQICDVLSYLHTHRPPILFENLKPSNVMVSESGYIYLIDFGIAGISNQFYESVASGPSGFAAPEQYSKVQNTPRSDIYSLGALLHCLLTGVDPSEHPFSFKPASELNPAVPRDLGQLLEKMLSMEVNKRPASIQDVVKVLRHVEQMRVRGTLTATNSGNTAQMTMARGSSLLQKAEALYRQKRSHDAVIIYDQVLQTESLNSRAWEGRGLALVLDGRYLEALESFDHALRLDPELVTSLNGKGMALNMLDRNWEALDAFNKSVRLESDNAASWNGKGTALSALEQPEEALTAFELALHFDMHMAPAWSNKGLVLHQLKRYAEALRAFEQALSLEPDNASYWDGKGIVLYEMGRLKEALEAYQEATHHNSDDARALYGIGNVLYTQHKYKSALDHYDQAVKYDPQFVKAWDKRGNVLGDMERFPDALDSYEQALRIDLSYAPAWNGKASVLCQLERFKEALQAYEQALRLNPNAPQAWNGKGNAYYQLGDYQNALAAYEKAWRLNPKMASALHNMSLVLKHLHRYEEALDAADSALRLAPHDPDNWQRKAEALRKLRRGKEARAAEAEVIRWRSGV